MQKYGKIAKTVELSPNPKLLLKFCELWKLKSVKLSPILALKERKNN
jgi:hypothetical protein